MDNAVMQSQGNLLRDVNYFQQRWSHSHKAEGGKEELDRLPHEHECGG